MQKLLFLITAERNEEILLYVDEKERNTAELILQTVNKETHDTQIANARRMRKKMSVGEIARELNTEKAYTAKLTTQNSFEFFKFIKIERL